MYCVCIYSVGTVNGIPRDLPVVGHTMPLLFYVVYRTHPKSQKYSPQKKQNICTGQERSHKNYGHRIPKIKQDKKSFKGAT